MKKNLTIKTFFIFFILISIIFTYLNFNKVKEDRTTTINKNIDREIPYNSNIILDVNYSSVDMKGNEYKIYAEKGEIDFNNSNIVYLTNVNAIIKPIMKDKITITSKFGKYNTRNFDTIFSKNVIIKYIDNKITGEYLDFSINRNSLIMSKNVIFSNLENILQSDVVEINLETKDTKIFMFENKKKVNIKSKN